MSKNILAVAALATLLAACGREDTRTPASLQALVLPSSAPWLNVEPAVFDVPVRGVEGKVVLKPSPSVPEVVQAQLRHATQPSYFTDLVIACRDAKVSMKVETPDDAPSQAGLELSLHCTINARGFVSGHDYSAHPALPVPADKDYAALFARLLDAADGEIGGKLAADIRASRR